MDLDPDIPLTDKDDQEEEPSQNVAGIQNPEGYLDILTGLTGLIVMVVDKEMNSLNGPQNAKDKEQFHVKDLKDRVFDHKCTKFMFMPMVVLQRHHHLAVGIEKNFLSKFHVKSYFCRPVLIHQKGPVSNWNLTLLLCAHSILITSKNVRKEGAIIYFNF